MKKQIFSFCLILFPFFSFSQFDILIWEDEFDYSGLPDSTKWSYDIGGHGWGNEELQYYTDQRLQNARVENGKLIIEAKKELYRGKNYTSARLVSREKGDWAYGRMEVRAKLPKGTGTWSAIWMLPTKWIYGNGGWPDVGEIDIMEHVGYDEGVIHGTIHSHDFNHMNGTQKGDQVFIGDATSAFHVYAIEWTEDKIDWYVDDQKYFTYENNGDGWSAWPFDHPFHLILNIAIGGTWGGTEGVDNSIFPQKLEVDYVRVYQTKDQLSNLIEGPDELVPNAAKVKFSSKLFNGKNFQWSLLADAEVVTEDNQRIIWVNWGCQEGKVIHSAEINGTTYKDTLPVLQKKNKIKGDLFWNTHNTPLHFFLDSMHSTSYQWKVPDGVTIINGQNSTSIQVQWNGKNGGVAVNINNNCITKEISRQVLDPAGQYAYPDPIHPHAVPGIIQAIEYDYGGEGIAYHDMESMNQGNGPRQENGVDTEFKEPNGNVGWFETGEWLEYTIHAEDTVVMDAVFRVASLGGGGPVRILLNGQTKLDNVAIPDTDGWDNFIDHPMGSFLIFPQDTILRIEATGGGFNLGEMKFTESQTTNIIKEHESNGLLLYPNPAGSRLFIECKENIQSLEIFNIYGVKVLFRKLYKKKAPYIIDISDLPDGLYVIRFHILEKSPITEKFYKKNN